MLKALSSEILQGKHGDYRELQPTQLTAWNFGRVFRKMTLRG